VWFIAYHHSLRPAQAGIKFVLGGAEATAENQRLVARGYVITNAGPIAKARKDAFLAGTLSDLEQRLFG
jgi:hypothetical protein